MVQNNIVKNINLKRENIVKELLDEYNINLKVIELIKKFDNKNKFKYHNINHIYSFVLNLVSMPKFKSISKYQQRLLIIAGLFHDSGYLGKKDDLENINSAIRFFKLTKHLLDLNIIEVNYIEMLILSTINDYRYNPSILELVEYSSLMQDADLMTNFEDDSEIFRQGLSEELNVNITIESTIDFLKNYDIKEPTNKYIYEEGIKKLISQLKNN